MLEDRKFKVKELKIIIKQHRESLSQSEDKHSY